MDVTEFAMERMNEWGLHSSLTFEQYDAIVQDFEHMYESEDWSPSRDGAWREYEQRLGVNRNADNWESYAKGLVAQIVRGKGKG